ncbi:hypothetical protein BDV96DRAFT_685633 [Lophiotrema nucula]|uniref:Uncharacterized protein n=1 Tax=Lophiotrema nucula TaxID=690887 RepID=A0A6A5ZFK0_9PLEO|nr:hypothetical protein BDV96DRAFT_685633 [Lophiotrema nucula]
MRAPVSPSIMHRRTIAIRNHSGSPSAYYLFAEVPQRNGPTDLDSIDDLQTWRCVYQASPLVSYPNGSATFVVPDSYVAVCGSGKTPPSIGNRIFSGDWKSIILASEKSKGSRLRMTMPAGKEATFDSEAAPENDIAGESAFAISVDTSFSLPNPLAFPFVGYGALNPYNSDEMIPLVVYEAQPAATFVFIPSGKWIVTGGVVEPHALIPADSADGHAVVVEFPSLSSTSAEIIHDEKGELTCRYL